MTITASEIYLLNKMNPTANITQLGQQIQNAESVVSAEIALANGKILIGDGSGIASAVTPSGEWTITNLGVATLSNAAVIGKVLTGFVAGAGTVTAADTILSALQKLAADDAAYLPLAGGTMTGPLIISQGTISAPGLGFAGHADTGIYYASTNRLRVVSGGVDVVDLLDSGGPNLLLKIASAGTSFIYQNQNDGSMNVSGGSGSGAGANIFVYGGAHATKANVTEFRVGTSIEGSISAAGSFVLGPSGGTGTHIAQGSVFRVDNATANSVFQARVADTSGIDAYTSYYVGTLGAGTAIWATGAASTAGNYEYRLVYGTGATSVRPGNGTVFLKVTPAGAFTFGETAGTQVHNVIGSQLRFPPGSAATPGISISTGVEQTGLYRSSGALAISQAGVKVCQFSTDYIQLAPSTSGGTFQIANGVSDSLINLSGDTGNSQGGNIQVFGSTHATKPNWIELRGGTTVRLNLDNNGQVQVGTNGPAAGFSWEKFSNNITYSATQAAVAVAGIGSWTDIASDTDYTFNSSSTGHAGIHSYFRRTVTSNLTDTGTAGFSAIQARVRWRATGFTYTFAGGFGYSGLRVNAPLLDGGTLAISSYAGVQIDQSTLATGGSKYGVLIQAQSGGTNNWALLTTGLEQSQFSGPLGVGGTTTTAASLTVKNPSLSGTTQIGVDSQFVGSSAATGSIEGMRSRANSPAAAGPFGALTQFYANMPTRGAGSTITRYVGFASDVPTVANQGVNNCILSDNYTWTGDLFISSTSGLKSSLKGALAQVRADVASAATIASLSSANGFVRLTGSTATDLQGIAAGLDGQVLYLFNNSGQVITIRNESASATAADRIQTNSGADVLSVGNSGHIFIYDSSQSRWILMSNVP